MLQIDIFDQEYNAVLSAATYEDFADRLRAYNCRRCELCDSRSHIVVDRGNPQARILVVSERPGENEDATGKAFVGRAGEMLDKILASIGLDSNTDTLIVNVTKCKPPIDRSPSAAEAEACLPYLERQIHLVRPQVILLLGAVALKWIDPSRGDFTMEEEAGRFFTLSRFPGVQFMVLYHPAFLLRDPRKKKIMWEHMKLLRRFFEAEVAVGAAPGRTEADLAAGARSNPGAT